MAVSNSLPKPSAARTRRRFNSLVPAVRRALRATHPAWCLSAILFTYILCTSFIFSENPANFLPVDNPADIESAHSPDTNLSSAATADMLEQSAQLMRNRMQAARDAPVSTSLGSHFCVLQPTLSAGKSTWTPDDARKHIALRAFLRTFASTVTSGERRDFNFSIYYGHDSDDSVFGNETLRTAFVDEARSILSARGFTDDDVRLVFTPLYGLHGRINAIWNVLAKDAYYDGCDYFFLSNDDMVFFTPTWVSRSADSLNGIGSSHPHKRPCRHFGIVRFKDEWASWATFTFHVSTRMHLEIFGGVYYPVPYNSAHNDFWINFVYRNVNASKYRGEIRVRNRVEDVDYALAHQKDKSKIAPPRYTYDKRGDVKKYIHEGRARVQAWLDKYRSTERCQPPL